MKSLKEDTSVHREQAIRRSDEGINKVSPKKKSVPVLRNKQLSTKNSQSVE